MKLTDILPVEKWAELEEDIHDRSGLYAYVYDKNGMSITGFKRWANGLCPIIKANNKGLAFICAVANQTMANEAIKKKGPVIGECDAGLLKVTVPIFVRDQFIGVTGGCGLTLDDSEIESFLVHKLTDINEEEIQGLSDDIGKMTTDEAEGLIEYLQVQVDRIVNDFKERGK